MTPRIRLDAPTMQRQAGPVRRILACALLLVAAAPAAAYLPPATAILKRAAQHRQELRFTSLEVRGTIAFSGAAADRLRAATGLAVEPEATIPALLLVKVPGRCRLELAPPGTPAAQRPTVSARGERLTTTRGLRDVPAARALVEAVCTLLAEQGPAAEPERGLAHRLVQDGVDLRQVSFGRDQGRVAWVIGGKPQDGTPQAWIDKQSFLPVRLVAPIGGATRDVRLLEFGAAGAERFPRTVEVWSDGQREARFTTAVVTPNPRLPDAVF